VPRISVVVRKAYGAGLYAMSGPGFNPNVTLALPQAMIAVMGPEAAVNAVYFNKIQEQPEVERPAYVQAARGRVPSGRRHLQARERARGRRDRPRR
jgi:acetyl-CoA carboxylase carboxyltransferase component